MAEPHNPYRLDAPGRAPFFGRADDLERLQRALRSGRNAMAAVMGGRGMGKTALLVRLRERLERDPELEVMTVERVPTGPSDFVGVLSKKLGRSLDPCLPLDATVVHRAPAGPSGISLVSEHPREGGAPIRIHHVLVQLPC